MDKWAVYVSLPALLVGLTGCVQVDGRFSDGDRWGYAFPTTPDRSKLTRVRLNGLRPDATTLVGDSFVVFSALGEPRDADDWNSGRALASCDSQGRFRARPICQREDAAAEVSAYYHLQRYLDFYRSLGFRGFAAPLNIAVNFRPGGDGDFLAGATDVRGGRGLVVGQWGSRNLAYDPDVLGHELFHVVHSQIVPAAEGDDVENELDALGFNTTPMAVAEAAADYFSCTLSGDPDVGEYTAPALGLPFLSTLANGARLPQHRTGSSHADGQALSGALWEAREIVGPEALDQAVYDALATAPAEARRRQDAAPAAGARCYTFPLIAELLLKRLRERLEPTTLNEVRQVLAARGLTGPSDIVRLEPDQPRRLWVPGTDDLLASDLSAQTEAPTPLQLRFAVTPNAVEIVASVTVDEDDDAGEHEERDGPHSAALTVYLRADQPVRYELRDDTLVVDADLQAIAVEGDIELIGDSIERLRGREVYVSVTNSSEHDLDVLATVTIR
ncbi:MAG: hypothetical protein KKI02_08180 [Planctomycetes bacterium]|nr:hypothetical protein [Planctomycetota bacterium]